uniref:Uncharacterized protein n=1 Tax=viral metagenome TaxID=1070528 RepID=A0A6C0JJ22_9ZZZZ
MDNTNTNQPVTSNNTSNMFSDKNGLILILLLLLLFSFLGINLLNIGGDFIQRVNVVFAPFVSRILMTFGYTTGTVIDKTADVVTDVSKTGIDIAGGAAHSLGDLFIKASSGNPSGPIDLEKTINEAVKKTVIDEPKPDTTTNPIQKPISSAKTQWCLVGEYEGRRGCIEVTDQDKCLSGQVFPTQKMCLNPTYTNNMQPSLKPVRE